MSQRLLHKEDVSALAIESGGEGVSQGMDRGCALDPSFLDPLAEPTLNMPLGDALVVAVLEKRAVSEVFEVGSQMLLDGLAEEHLLGAVPFGGPDMDLAYVEIYIVDIECDRRSQPDPGSQHEVEKDMVAAIGLAGACRQCGHEPVCLSLGKYSGRRTGADGPADEAPRIMGCVTSPVEIPEEHLQRRPEGIDRGGFLEPTVGPSSRLWGRKEPCYILVRNFGKVATVANLARPVRKQTDVAVVLGNRAGRTAIGFELDEKLCEGLFNVHGGLLGITTLNLTHYSLG